MDTRGIERVVAVRNAQEAGALLERLRSQPRHLLERLAGAERTMGVAVQDDILRQTRSNSRDARQQRRGGRVGVDADRIDAILDHRIERARQFVSR